MSQEMNDLLASFLNAEEDHGFASNELIPTGVYPVEIAEIQRVVEGNPKKNEETGVVTPGSILVGMRLNILEGPLAGRAAFISMNLVNLFDASRAGTKFWNMSSTFIRVIGARLAPVNPALFESVEKACAAAYNAEAWKGLKFIANIKVETLESQKKKADKRGATISDSAQDRNTLSGWHSFDDVESGLAAWREKELPKQLSAGEKGKKVPAGSPAPVQAKTPVKF